MTEESNNWKPYLCNVNGKLGSILVNLGIRKVVPIKTKPWLLWTWVYFQSPRPDGLSDSKEAPILYSIEDALDSRLAETCKAIPCGRITTDGRREFYFYGETKDGFDQAVEAALRGFAGYKFDLGERDDPLWEHYFDVLYPSPIDLQRIANMDLLDVLVEKGDVLTAPRKVQHWMYFPSNSSRASFRDAAAGTGFDVASETNADGERPFGISVVRIQPIDQEAIDDTVIELMELSQRFNGEYDGWESPIVTQ